MNRPHSPARAHVERTLAAQRKPVEPPQSRNANAYELMLAKLAQDKRRLKTLQSIERRADVKRELLPEYGPWVSGVLEGNTGVQDDVLMTVMVWYLDIGDLTSALPLARYAVEHELVLPDQYQRTLGCLIAEEFAEAGLRDVTAKRPADVEGLKAAEELTAALDMHDQVRAKLLKAIGYALIATDKPAAVDYLKRALALHDKSGVKKDIERLERDIKNSAKDTGAGKTQPTGDQG